LLITTGDNRVINQSDYCISFWSSMGV